LVACFSSVDAAPISFNFSQGGFFEGASVTGMFTGDDLDNNGQLSSFAGEVSDFVMSFSGNSLIPSFSLGFSDPFALVYDLDGGPLGDGVTLDVEGIGAASGIHSYATGQGATGGIDGGWVDDFIGPNTTSELVQVSAVPIPPAVWLFGSGLLGLVGMARRKKA
jgi:hypothetical protein